MRSDTLVNIALFGGLALAFIYAMNILKQGASAPQPKFATPEEYVYPAITPGWKMIADTPAIMEPIANTWDILTMPGYKMVFDWLGWK